MVHGFWLGEEFFASLTEVDAQMARAVAARGCRWCGGALHRADYQRKPRGGLLAEAGEAFTRRHSLCCAVEGCRRRTLPPSLRFLGRRVYVEAVVVLASMVVQLVSTIREACIATGVPGWTLRRWSAWWRGAFVQSPTWALLRARLSPPPPTEADLPRSLFVRLSDEVQRRRGPPAASEVCRLLAQLLAPATTSAVPDWARFLRDLFEARTID